MPQASPTAELFSNAEQLRPLAERLRPATLAEIVGQDHLLGPVGPLRRMIDRAALSSLILWGPPGVGKTTIARLLADAAGFEFAALSAVFSGVADLKRVFDQAAKHRAAGQRTLLFVDEVHRFNRAQQDGFLPVVEDGAIVLIGATTENPSFALNGALLSRCQVLILRRLDDPALHQLLTRAEAAAGPLPLLPEARAVLCAMADGDGRCLLNMAEQLLAMQSSDPLDTAALANAIGRRAGLYDHTHDQHDTSLSSPAFMGEGASQTYALLSALHKSLRGSDPDAALYYAARFMTYGGDMADTVFRRLACVAAEDVGLADPQALVQVVTAWEAYRRVGWPEGRLFIAQAVTYVATAPKSNAAHLAFDKALSLAAQTKTVEPPPHVLNASTKLMRELGHGAGYQYDHDQPGAYAGQEFFPPALLGPQRPCFYVPTDRGYEWNIAARLRERAARKSGPVAT